MTPPFDLVDSCAPAGLREPVVDFTSSFRSKRRATFVVTAAPRRSNHETHLSTDFHVVRANAARMVGTTSVWRGTARVAISDRERTIVDALIHPSWIGGGRHLGEVLGPYRDSKEFDPVRLLSRLDEQQVGASYKRLGYFAEQLWPDQEKLIEHAHAKITTGTIRLDPGVKTHGKMCKRWGLWVNITIPRNEAHSDS